MCTNFRVFSSRSQAPRELEHERSLFLLIYSRLLLLIYSGTHLFTSSTHPSCVYDFGIYFMHSTRESRESTFIYLRSPARARSAFTRGYLLFARGIVRACPPPFILAKLVAFQLVFLPFFLCVRPRALVSFPPLSFFDSFSRLFHNKLARIVVVDG